MRALKSLFAPVRRPPTVLIVGHSHISCVARAVPAELRDRVETINLHESKAFLDERSGAVDKSGLKTPKPSALCLCLAGNYHNQIGLLEHPQKFGFGLASGALPDMASRRVIPYAVIKDQFEIHYRRFGHLIRYLHAAFPKATPIHLNPPPPINDWDHIKQRPGIFRKMLPLGLLPAAMRLELYEMQTEIHRDFARTHDATFITTPDQARDADGFLASGFKGDATHGSTAYGRLMLEQINSLVGIKP